MIAEGFTCQRYGFNVGADKFSLLTIENGKTSIMRLSEWTLISQSQKSHSDRLLGGRVFWRWRGRSLSCRDVWYYQAAFLVFYLVTIC